MTNVVVFSGGRGATTILNSLAANSKRSIERRDQRVRLGIVDRTCP